MGLDMYAFVTRTKPEQVVDFERSEDSSELHYWRKHPNLHGWMQALYVRKDGKDPNFNLSAVVVDADDLTALEEAVRQGALPETEGFFFGQSDGSEREDDIAFIAEARAAIADGMTVLYVAWW